VRTSATPSTAATISQMIQPMTAPGARSAGAVGPHALLRQ
jgi:hypothetical protein